MASPEIISKSEESMANRFANLAFYFCFGTFVCWGLIAFIGDLRYQPPAPLPLDANARVFSAARAEIILNELVGDGIPHPAGSVQNDVVRERIVAMTESWGYQVEVQRTQNNKYRSPKQPLIPLENIMFRKPGLGNGKAILLLAHYDSRPEGPGASDDGVGTSAVLEIARMLSKEPPLGTDIIFLITDGEEFNLLGADKWCEEHPWAKEVEVAINLEARGTTGGSLMFETSGESRWLVELFARVTERPLASSLFFEVYRFLPNDTDFTMIKRAGIQGYNFAFIGEVRNYHTPQDSLENVDRGCLQHHGQNALALVRALAQTDFDSQPGGRSVYFDLFGRVVVRWPASWSVWFAVLAFALTASSVPRILAGKSNPVSKLVVQASFVGLMLLLVLGVCVAVGIGLGLDSRLAPRWPKSPLPVALAYWCAGVATLAFSMAWLGDRIETGPLTLVIAMGWSVLAVATSLFLTGGCYLFLIPSLVIGFSLLCFNRKPGLLASFLVVLLSGVIWIPMERLFYDALGFINPAVLGVRIVAVLSLLVPMLCAAGKRRSVIGWIGVAGFVGSVLAAILLNSTG